MPSATTSDTPRSEGLGCGTDRDTRGCPGCNPGSSFRRSCSSTAGPSGGTRRSASAHLGASRNRKTSDARRWSGTSKASADCRTSSAEANRGNATRRYAACNSNQTSRQSAKHQPAYRFRITSTATLSAIAHSNIVTRDNTSR